MKITGFRPIILTSKSEEAVSLFEALGFQCNHKKEGIPGDVTSYAMKDENGFRVVVSQVDSFPQVLTMIAMNVDNFEEAYDFLISKGFKNASGDNVTDTGSSKACMMVSPSGFAISLSQHIKK